MSLLAFQTSLGRLIRTPAPGSTAPATVGSRSASGLSPGERAQLESLATSAGLRFTICVQRSWCESRAANAALQTLSLLPDNERQRLLNEWVGQGGGTSSFFANEAEAFLEFIACHLSEPSHALTLCRLEQAVFRTSSRAASFEPPNRSVLDAPDARVRAGQHAALVPFFVEPDELLPAVRRRESLPQLAEPLCHLLFAPGLSGLFRRARRRDTDVWMMLAKPVALSTLLTAGHKRVSIEALLGVGAIDAVPSSA